MEPFIREQESKREEVDKLIDTLYQELRKLAHVRMRKLAPGQTLQTTSLVHEAYIRLARNPQAVWKDRRHFFGAAAIAMRNIIVESLRRKAAIKRGGDLVRVELSFAMIADSVTVPSAELLDLNCSLNILQESYPEHAELMYLHFFAGLSLREAGALMGISHSTTMRRWRFARAWMYKRIVTSDLAPSHISDTETH